MDLGLSMDGCLLDRGPRRLERNDGGRDGGARLDAVRTCYEPWNEQPMRDRVFTPGMLDGVWEGRWLVC
ncbi:hypothetical protein JB92DRAFT_2877774 [Gautieria morchelliformis]|nr:hypothetical protein JB92DRAFT_2877774 [Gautieria morchelliformis]